MSDDFDTGTVAAAIGGTTTVIEYVTADRGERPARAPRDVAATGRAGVGRLRPCT